MGITSSIFAPTCATVAPYCATISTSNEAITFARLAATTGAWDTPSIRTWWCARGSMSGCIRCIRRRANVRARQDELRATRFGDVLNGMRVFSRVGEHVGERHLHLRADARGNPGDQ